MVPRITKVHGLMKVLATYAESEASEEMEAGARDNLPSVETQVMENTALC